MIHTVDQQKAVYWYISFIQLDLLDVPSPTDKKTNLSIT